MRVAGEECHPDTIWLYDADGVKFGKRVANALLGPGQDTANPLDSAWLESRRAQARLNVHFSAGR
jgi:hypothetical protein